MIIEHRIKNCESKVFISNHLIERLYTVSLLHYPKEYGGILTGIRKNNLTYILDFETPKMIENSDNEFVRHVENINFHLKSIYDSSDGTLEYLGEWHSHPNSSPEYSSNDQKSMIEISNDPDVKTNSPMLIITSITKQGNSYKLFQVVNQNLNWYNESNTI